MNSSGDFRLGVLDELTPGEAALLEHFRALPVDERRALLDALDRAAKGARPLAFRHRDGSVGETAS